MNNLWNLIENLVLVIVSLREAINDSILPDFMDCFGHTLTMTFLFGGAALVALIKL